MAQKLHANCGIACTGHIEYCLIGVEQPAHRSSDNEQQKINCHTAYKVNNHPGMEIIRKTFLILCSITPAVQQLKPVCSAGDPSFLQKFWNSIASKSDVTIDDF